MNNKSSKLFTSRLFTSLATLTAGVLIFSGIASAHVSVKPTTSATGAWETYTIKIPSEKETPTTKVTLKVPAGVNFKQYQPVPEWKVTTDKNADGSVKSVTWSATGSGINAGEFQQFNFVAQNPDKDTDAAWDAYQYYEDGSIVEWTGDEGSDSPHAITKISAAPATDQPASDQGHTQGNAPTNTGTTEQGSSDAASSTSNGLQTTTLVVSIVALLLSVITLALSLRRRK
ncbi:YcnI family copper-binding membrane protein [Paenibacillus pini]|uniref:Membrane protein n=1 Tax=Paenibacillus pini JCM 16418 TaxID=1236976 RepID=W7Z669_9BACL|nr:DUF1775 domain-containing protein [Paenibacillus pini]GAF09824.1 membrane protein [Paenibacillus pini JCM 16418]